MALIKMGALAQDVRGSLNGSVFSRNRGGAYVRSKVSPVQPISKWSGLVRCIFAAISRQWSSTLTDAYRANWEAFSAVHPIANVFGDSVILSGVACYLKVNAYLRMCGCAYLSDVPATFVVADIGVPTVVGTAAGGHIALAVSVGRALTGDEGIMVYCTAPLVGSRAPQQGDYKMLNLVGFDTYLNGTAIGGVVEVRIPNISWTVGDKIGLYVAVLNKVTGATSPWVPVLHTLTAP
jgi:hypothetical protein